MGVDVIGNARFVFVSVLFCCWHSIVSAQLQPEGSVAAVGVNKLEIESRSRLRQVAPDRITHFSIVDGPSTRGGGARFDANGELEQGALDTWSQISFQWQLDDKTRFVFNPRFTTKLNAIQGQEQQADWDDPVIGITRVWYQKEKFVFSGALNTILPFLRTQSTIDRRRFLNPGGFQFISYQYTPKLSFDAQLWGRWILHQGADRPATENNFNYFWAPQITYRLTDDFQLIGFYQVNGALDQSWKNRVDDDQSLNLQLSYNVNQAIVLQPLLTLYRKQNFDLGKANIGLCVSGQLY